MTPLSKNGSRTSPIRAERAPSFFSPATRAMRAAAQALETPFRRQGLEPARARERACPRIRMVQEFRENPQSVLFGVDSFWSGVDVPGEALSSVIITRLPFVDAGPSSHRSPAGKHRGGGRPPFRTIFAARSHSQAPPRSRTPHSHQVRHGHDCHPRQPNSQQAVRTRLSPCPARMPDPDSLKPDDGRKFGCLSVLGWVLVAAALTTALTLLAVLENERRKSRRRPAAWQNRSGRRFRQDAEFHPADQCGFASSSSPQILQCSSWSPAKTGARSHRWTHTWLYSTKNLELEATFTAKSGLRPHDPVRINIDPRTRFVSADLPPRNSFHWAWAMFVSSRTKTGSGTSLPPQDREAGLSCAGGKSARNNSPNRSSFPRRGWRVRSAFVSLSIGRRGPPP